MLDVVTNNFIPTAFTLRFSTKRKKKVTILCNVCDFYKIKKSLRRIANI